MNTCPDWLIQYLSCEVLIWLAVFSIVAFVGTLLAIPAILIRLPKEYFHDDHPRTWMEDHHPILRHVGLAIKNVVGTIFLVAGFAMLFLPGQGLLTMVIGISLIDFPGKRKIEKRLVSQPTIFQAINALREKFGKPPFILSDTPTQPE
jgi:hypothetical protein